MIVNSEDDQLFEFKREHGGFNVGVAIRKGFNQKRLVAVDERDTDNDGVVDRCDNCPRLAGDQRLGGCPDSDHDGLIDLADSCPDEWGDPASCGCPDDDGDGIPNSCDCCPDEPGERQYHGCPKEHQTQYEHIRVPTPLRKCPLCPPDLPLVQRRPGLFKFHPLIGRRYSLKK